MNAFNYFESLLNLDDDQKAIKIARVHKIIDFHLFRLRKTKIDQRKLFDQANQMVDLAKVSSNTSKSYSSSHVSARNCLLHNSDNLGKMKAIVSRYLMCQVIWSNAISTLIHAISTVTLSTYCNFNPLQF